MNLLNIENVMDTMITINCDSLLNVGQNLPACNHPASPAAVPVPSLHFQADGLIPGYSLPVVANPIKLCFDM